jgi:hypothetical protein
MDMFQLQMQGLVRYVLSPLRAAAGRLECGETPGPICGVLDAFAESFDEEEGAPEEEVLGEIDLLRIQLERANGEAMELEQRAGRMRRRSRD